VTSGGSEGEGFGENRQYEARFGGNLGVGGELSLGPGALLVELGTGLSDLDGLITGDASASSLELFLGYRLLF
jgi:hypothetical protein